MTDTATQLERLERVVAALERLGGVGIAPLTAVDPDGYPGHVSAGELIESAWGNAVVDKLRAAQPATPPWYVATGANDALPTGLTNITWPSQAGTAFTYDTPNKRLVVAAESAGAYLISARMQANTGAPTDIRLNIGGGGPEIYISPTTGGSGAIAALRTLNTGDTIAFQVNNPGAATTVVTARLEAVRLKV